MTGGGFMIRYRTPYGFNVPNSTAREQLFLGLDASLFPVLSGDERKTDNWLPGVDNLTCGR